MITILKEAIITLNGVDCKELLVRNDSLINDPAFNHCHPYDGTCCDLCIYKDYEPEPSVLTSCMNIHGCTSNALTYFIAEPL